jgi:hypothetical protein
MLSLRGEFEGLSPFKLTPQLSGGHLNTFQIRDFATAARRTHAPAAQSQSLAVWCFFAAQQQKNTIQPIVGGMEPPQPWLHAGLI